MAKYLLASDYDNTLRRWPDEVTEEDKAAIRRFRKAGNYFVIVTGRVFETIENELKATGFNDIDMLLCLSGALGLDADRNVLFESKGDGKIIKPLIDDLEKMNARLVTVDVCKKSYSMAEFDYKPYGETVPVEKVAGIPHFTSMCVGFYSVDSAKDAAVALKENYGEYVTPLHNGFSVDMPPSHVNKGIAVKRAADILGVPDDKIYTVGDNFNDMDMLRRFHGRAIWNSEPEVLEAAEKSVKTIAEIIEEIMENDS